MGESGNILVSVIMPAYNAERYLAESIERALGQTVAELEVVLVDDGSKDGTVQIAESYGERVRIFRQENGGAAAARNHAVRQAKGEWIVSGILKEKRADYLEGAGARGWELIEELEEDEWIALRFTHS